MIELKNKSDSELMSELKVLRRKETNVIADIVLHLAEVETRGIFREAGYSSLFTYCTECLGYSEGGAARRVRASKCLIKTPSVYEQLKSGQITLCSLSEVAPIVTDKNHMEVFKAITGVSKRTAQEIAISFGAPVQKKRSVIRSKRVVTTPPALVDFTNTDTLLVEDKTEKLYSFSFEVKEDTKALYDQACLISGSTKPEELFEKLLKEFVARKTREPRVIAKTKIVKAKDPKTSTVSRAIPLKTKREVFKRDNRQCTYVAKDGKRCTKRHNLEIDHIRPFSLGGSNDLSNLRLLCKSHNLLQAEYAFGRDFIKSFTSAGGVTKNKSA
jgi:5-methylcytosine-specific restriction endonuclease McrA